MTPKNILFNPGTGLLRSGWRIPWLLLWVLPWLTGVTLLDAKVLPRLPAPWLRPVKALVGGLLILGTLAIYRLFARFVERRDPSEVDVARDTPRHVGLGLLLGAGPILLITAVLVMSGSFHVAGFNSPWLLTRALVFYLPQTFLEDFIYCLILYRLLREGLGRRPALVLAPLLFGLAHAGNANESLLGLTEIFTGGIVMYYLFERSGSFWTIWSLHFFWNFSMNGVLGMANSGHDIPGFLRSATTGPAWLTGGATGPEASVLAVGLDLLVLLVLTRMPDRWFQTGQS